MQFTREEGGQSSDSSVLHTNGSGRSRIEVASAASAWLVAISTTLVRVIAFVSSQHRSEAKFARVGGGVWLLENRTGVESVAYVTSFLLNRV